LHSTKKQPLASLLVARGLAADLPSARSLIMSGRVVVDEHRIDKPGTPVALRADIRIKDPASPYVGRGGEKLAAPLATFNITVTDKSIIDVGASTGGFTDCLLQQGAARVIAVDVGYGQLAWKLQQDPRVTVLDRTNIRDLTPADVQPPPDMAVIDASFISLAAILPHVVGLLKPEGEILCLAKPQFEAPPDAVGAGGIVSSEKQYQEVIRAVVQSAHSLSLRVMGIMESPIRGRKGNREFFIYLRKVPQA